MEGKRIDDPQRTMEKGDGVEAGEKPEGASIEKPEETSAEETEGISSGKAEGVSTREAEYISTRNTEDISTEKPEGISTGKLEGLLAENPEESAEKPESMSTEDGLESKPSDSEIKFKIGKDKSFAVQNLSEAVKVLTEAINSHGSTVKEDAAVKVDAKKSKPAKTEGRKSKSPTPPVAKSPTPPPPSKSPTPPGPSSKGHKSTKSKKEEKEFRKEIKCLEELKKKCSGNEEAVLSNILRKYQGMYDEIKKQDGALVESHKRLDLMRRERDMLQADNQRQLMRIGKTEALCRLQQQQNKQIKDEYLVKLREEQEKRKEVTCKLQVTLTQLDVVLAENSARSSQLHDDNVEMSQKLAHLHDQISRRSEETRSVEKQLELQKQLFNTELSKNNLEFEAEKEVYRRQIELLQYQLQEKETEIKISKNELSGMELKVDEYIKKYADIEPFISQSSKLFETYKGKIETINAAKTALETEMFDWQKKYNDCMRIVVDLTIAVKLKEKEVGVLERKLERLQKLCRQLQTDRSTFIKQLKGAGIEPGAVQEELVLVEKGVKGAPVEEPTEIAVGDNQETVSSLMKETISSLTKGNISCLIKETTPAFNTKTCDSRESVHIKPSPSNSCDNFESDPSALPQNILPDAPNLEQASVFWPKVDPSKIILGELSMEEINLDLVKIYGDEGIRKEVGAKEEGAKEGVIAEEVGAEKVYPKEVGAEEVGPKEVGTEEVSPEDVSPEEVSPGNVGAKELDGKVGSKELDAKVGSDGVNGQEITADRVNGQEQINPDEINGQEMINSDGINGQEMINAEGVNVEKIVQGNNPQEVVNKEVKVEEKL